MVLLSPDGKLLVSLGNGGCRVWDVTSSKAVASLPKGNVSNSQDAPIHALPI